jgi:hypothetical protein
MVAGIVASFALAPAASADTLQLTIQPIQVCDDAGTGCANPDRVLFGSLTRAIWLQAGIWLSALEWHSVFSGSLLDATMGELARGVPQSAGVLNVWFVDEILGCGAGLAVYGCGFLGGNGIAIATHAVTEGRADVLAHEIGHNLGLGHVLDPMNLMAFGEWRLIPTGLEEVGTLSRLEPGQIALARGSPQLVPVPEPGSLTLVLAGAGALVLRRCLARSGRPRARTGRPDGTRPRQTTCLRPTTMR